MAELDRGAKLALGVDAEGVLALALPGVSVIGPLPQEVVSAMRTADAAFEVLLDGERAVAHVELEAEPTSSAGARVARAACLLHFATGLPVRAAVFYLHEASDGRRPLDGHELPVGEDALPFRFRRVAFCEQDPEPILAGQVVGLLPWST